MPHDDRMKLELLTCTQRDAVQAILYRRGDDRFDPLVSPFIYGNSSDRSKPVAAGGNWLPAFGDAWTGWFISRLDKTRKRWIARVFQDGAADRDRPPHEQQQLVLALKIASDLPGGLMVEDLRHLGDDPVHRAAVIAHAAETVGLRMYRVGAKFHSSSKELPGTLAVGRIGTPDTRRGGVAAEDRQSFAKHVERLNRDCQRALTTIEARARYQETRELLDQAVSNVSSADWLSIVNGIGVGVEGFQPTSSPIFADLTPDGARELARDLLNQGASRDRTTQILQTYGFINPHGRRGWTVENLDALGV